MKILHLAAGNRWTGAAAPAFAEAAALREAGVDAHYAYVGGYKLQAKLERFDFAHPIIAKAQNPFSFASSMATIEQLIDHHQFDVVHAHLTYDHWLARFATRIWQTRLARTFHSLRVIRSDPFTRILLHRTHLVCVVNASLRDVPQIRNRGPLFTPPPLDTGEFTPEGRDVRDQYAATDVLLLVAIGKLAPHRGFELLLQTFATIHKRMPKTKLMVIGHGPHRPHLEQLASELQVDADVIWAGYHEDDLADHYRAADVLLFVAKGSDEGHRAVLEAMGCGTVPIVAPLPGIDALVDERLIARETSADAIAECLFANLSNLDALRHSVVSRASEFSYLRAAERLMSAYSAIL